jgi:hypothetical protein
MLAGARYGIVTASLRRVILTGDLEDPFRHSSLSEPDISSRSGSSARNGWCWGDLQADAGIEQQVS